MENYERIFNKLLGQDVEEKKKRKRDPKDYDIPLGKCCSNECFKRIDKDIIQHCRQVCLMMINSVVNSGG